MIDFAIRQHPLNFGARPETDPFFNNAKRICGISKWFAFFQPLVLGQHGGITRLRLDFQYVSRTVS
jgi:hypothetical protein